MLLPRSTRKYFFALRSLWVFAEFHVGALSYFSHTRGASLVNIASTEDTSTSSSIEGDAPEPPDQASPGRVLRTEAAASRPWILRFQLHLGQSLLIHLLGPPTSQCTVLTDDGFCLTIPFFFPVLWLPMARGCLASPMVWALTPMVELHGDSGISPLSGFSILSCSAYEAREVSVGVVSTGRRAVLVPRPARPSQCRAHCLSWQSYLP